MRIPMGWLFLFFFSSTSFATFLPDNDLWKQDQILGLDQSGGVSEADFNQVIDKVANALDSSVKLHGGKLKVMKKWSDKTVNAGSMEVFGYWIVQMFGGLARRPEVTKDGFALVMCHEMGHHLGGFPLYSGAMKWAASEGQADYYATEVCARKVWASEKVENAKSRFDVDNYAKNQCDTAWKDQDDQNLCYRISAGARSLSMLLATVKKEAEKGTKPTVDPTFSTPDQLQVAKTNESYASIQCRMDTYLGGSVCTAQFDTGVIPGRSTKGHKSNLDPEKEAAQYSCFKGSHQLGFRPACWFKQSI